METDTVQIELPDERFHVADAGSANFVVRKVIESRRYGERAEAFAAAEIRRAQREEQYLLSRFGDELEAWARVQIEKQYRRKSLSLPAGTVGFRIDPQRLVIQDETSMLAWCRTFLPSAIKTTHAVLKSTVADHVKSSGELPPGIEIVGGQERFFVR